MEETVRRVYRFDHAKAFLMICVVFGHILYLFNKDMPLSKGVYIFLYTFHMPVFVFLSGLFSKKAIVSGKLNILMTYGLVYTVMRFLETICRMMNKMNKALDGVTYQKWCAWIQTSEFKELLHSDEKFRFFWTDSPSWYILAMIIFFIVTYFIHSCNGYYAVAAAMIIGSLAGLDSTLGDNFAAMRSFVYYPLFLAGFYMHDALVVNDGIAQLDKKLLWTLRIAAVILLVVVFQYSIQHSEEIYPVINFIKGKSNYYDLGFGMMGIIYRIGSYIFWFMITASILILSPAVKTPFAWIGKRTMSILIWHSLIIQFAIRTKWGTEAISGKMKILTYSDNKAVILVLLAAVLIAILTAFLPDLRECRYEGYRKGIKKNI